MAPRIGTWARGRARRQCCRQQAGLQAKIAGQWVRRVLAVGAPIPYFRFSTNPGPRGGLLSRGASWAAAWAGARVRCTAGGGIDGPGARHRPQRAPRGRVGCARRLGKTPSIRPRWPARPCRLACHRSSCKSRPAPRATGLAQAATGRPADPEAALGVGCFMQPCSNY